MSKYFVPVHIKTNTRYPAITEEERQKNWSKWPYADPSKFRFEEQPQPAAKEPIEAKKAEPAAKQAEEKNANA